MITSPSTSPEIVKIKLWRLGKDGRRTKWVFTVDNATKTILNEVPADTLVPADPAMIEPDIAKFHGTAQSVQQTMRILGAKTRPLPGGGTEILSISDRGHSLMSFFNDDAPCPAFVPDCARLRQRYRSEKEALPKKDDGTCVSCPLSELMRKYIILLEKMLPP